MDILNTASDLLRIAVVGHTNTGKTSLLRTLLHNYQFGQVADSAGTTRHVEGVKMQLNGQPIIEWFDTPGLEDGIALLDYLDQINTQSQVRLDGLQSVQRFLQTPESRGRFEQEARVLRQLSACHAGLYVIDVREPVLSKYKDELAILSRCGKPLIPVLNFINSQDNDIQAWKNTFAALGIHVYIAFDTVAPAIDGEMKLYQKLALVLENQQGILLALADDTQKRRQLRYRVAYNLLAELLLDIATYQQQSKNEPEAIQSTWHQMQEGIRQRENRFIHDLLAHYRFNPNDYPQTPLPIQADGHWAVDLFSTEALLDMGIQIGKGFAAGAMVGATIDVLTAGLSLGTAALLGGVVGSVWQGADKFGQKLMGKINGYQTLSADESILRLLAVRGISLIQALEQRGHAAQSRIERVYHADVERWQKKALPSTLRHIRHQSHWSKLSSNFKSSSERDKAMTDLAQSLQEN